MAPRNTVGRKVAAVIFGVGVGGPAIAAGVDYAQDGHFDWFQYGGHGGSHPAAKDTYHVDVFLGGGNGINNGKDINYGMLGDDFLPAKDMKKLEENGLYNFQADIQRDGDVHVNGQGDGKAPVEKVFHGKDIEAKDAKKVIEKHIRDIFPDIPNGAKVVVHYHDMALVDGQPGVEKYIDDSEMADFVKDLPVAQTGTNYTDGKLVYDFAWVAGADGKEKPVLKGEFNYQVDGKEVSIPVDEAKIIEIEGGQHFQEKYYLGLENEFLVGEHDDFVKAQQDAQGFFDHIENGEKDKPIGSYSDVEQLVSDLHKEKDQLNTDMEGMSAAHKVELGKYLDNIDLLQDALGQLLSQYDYQHFKVIDKDSVFEQQIQELRDLYGAPGVDRDYKDVRDKLENLQVPNLKDAVKTWDNQKATKITVQRIPVIKDKTEVGVDGKTRTTSDIGKEGMIYVEFADGGAEYRETTADELDALQQALG